MADKTFNFLTTETLNTSCWVIWSSYLQRTAETYSFGCAISHMASCLMILVTCFAIFGLVMPLLGFHDTLVLFFSHLICNVCFLHIHLVNFDLFSFRLSPYNFQYILQILLKPLSHYCLSSGILSGVISRHYLWAHGWSCDI